MQTALATQPEQKKKGRAASDATVVSPLSENTEQGLIMPAGLPRFLQPKPGVSQVDDPSDRARSASMGLPRFLQAKLAVSQPHDPSEQEADAVAEQVMRMPAPAPDRSLIDAAPVGAVSIQRRCEACDEEPLQRAAQPSYPEPSLADSDRVTATLQQAGRPLDAGLRNFFEPRFGREFGSVRIHTNAEAAASARSVGALAYTVGSDVVFNTGQYAPHSDAGRRLLAHELTHVVQQKNPARNQHASPHNVPSDNRSDGNNGAVTPVTQAPMGVALQRTCAGPLAADVEQTITVPYDPDFATFYASVARRLGRHVVFRSDGGERLSALTRQALQDIHPTIRVATGTVTLAFTLLRCTETRRVEDIQLREVTGDVTRHEREPDSEPTPTPVPPATPTATPLPTPTPPADAVATGLRCTAEALDYASQFADDVLARIEYDAETERWNRNEGRERGDWGQAMYDAWGHCYIAACMTRSVPEAATWAWGTFYEYLHEAISQVTLGIVEHNSLSQDLYNQAVGRDLGVHHPDGDLYEICFDAMMRGRLDLTLAGVVPRGRPLVQRPL